MGKKGAKTVDENRRAAARGHDFAKSNCKECAFEMAPGRLPTHVDRRELCRGPRRRPVRLPVLLRLPHDALYGRAHSSWPSKSEEWGIVVEQAEDEIAAVNMAIGASFAGARSMTATAGGGFALMVEGISLAAMTETPIVVMVGQRPAPATGLPTRTEQGDLLFVLHAGHGEFPRVVLCTGLS